MYKLEPEDATMSWEEGGGGQGRKIGVEGNRTYKALEMDENSIFKY